MAPLDRRQFCRALGVAAVGGLAGCLGDEPSDGDPDDATNASTESSGAALAQVPRDDWPMHGYDAANTGYNPDTSGPNSPVSAQWTLDDPPANAPVVVDGTVYSVAQFGPLAAIDPADGSVRWQYDAVNEIVSWVAVLEGIVYAVGRGSAGRALHAIDADAGETLWTHDDVGSQRASPVAADGAVYASSGRRVQALDATTGTVLWEADAPQSVGNAGFARDSDLVVDDGTVYAVSGDDAVTALDAADGDERWTVDVEPNDQNRLGLTAADGVVYVETGRRVLALDATDGSERWTIEALWSESGVAVADGTLFACDRSSLRAFDADTGEREWEGTHGSWSYTAPVVADGTAYHGAGSGAVVAYDVATGEVAWEFETDVFESARPTTPVVVDGVVFYSDDTGFYALTSDEN